MKQSKHRTPQEIFWLPEAYHWEPDNIAETAHQILRMARGISLANPHSLPCEYLFEVMRDMIDGALKENAESKSEVAREDA
jgi:hypothetical protein